MDWSPLFAFSAGYLLGSIPFGLLLAHATGKGDLRKVGSGNIGATNALRAGGPWLGVTTLVLDMAKGAGAVWIGGWLGEGGALAGGAGAFIGHLMSIWLAFRGGKGVATMLGVTSVALLPAGAAAASTWILTAVTLRYSSLAGIFSSVAAPITAAILGHWWEAALFSAMAALLISRHRPNIARLKAGTEPKIGSRVTSPDGG